MNLTTYFLKFFHILRQPLHILAGASIRINMEFTNVMQFEYKVRVPTKRHSFWFILKYLMKCRGDYFSIYSFLLYFLFI